MKAPKCYPILMLCTAFFMLTSCDKIEEASEVDVSIPDFSVDIASTVMETPLRNAKTDFYHFSGAATLSSSDPAFSDISDYASSKVKSITFAKVTVNITSPNGGSVVKEFTLSLSGNGQSFLSTSDYAFGIDYSSNELNNYLANVIYNVIKDGTVTITASGLTDVPAGDALNIKIKFEDIVAKVRLIS